MNRNRKGTLVTFVERNRLLFSKASSNRIMKVITDPTIKTTEAIRKNGWVHGSVSPIPLKSVL